MQKIICHDKNNYKGNPKSTILKFKFPDFITQNENYEFKNIDETKNSLWLNNYSILPFVKQLYISGNFIAIERFSIVEWEDVKDAVAEQIENLSMTEEQS